jgi:predicted secreted protein
MTALAKSGIGTVVAVGDGASPEVFTAIAEIVSADGPSIEAEDIDVTTLDSTGGFKEFISGLKDGGTLDLSLLFTKGATQIGLRADLEATPPTARNYRLTIPTSPNTIADFSATPKSFSHSQSPTAALAAEVSLKISGAITWT